MVSIFGTGKGLAMSVTGDNSSLTDEEITFDETGASELPTNLIGIHYLKRHLQRRIFEEWLTFDSKLSLARVVRRGPLEEAIKNGPGLVREFQNVLTLLRSREIALTLDFSSAKRTYMDWDVPSIQDQLTAIPLVIGKFSILVFNSQACHPSTFVELGEALLKRPDLLPIVKSASVCLPRDMIWRLDNQHRRAILSPPRHEIPILWDKADVTEFLHGLVCKFESLNDGSGHVDPVHLVRAIYIYTCNWKPSSGRTNFVLLSWGLGWGKRPPQFKQFQKLLEDRAPLQTIKKKGGR